ncbi:MAG TPA: alpha/beta fold hydrolase [Gammaproteobacteria bacterium]
MQSILASGPFRARTARKRAAALLAAARPEILDCGAGVRLLGYHSAQPDRPRGLVILLHGWEGSADSSYMISAGARAFEAGFDVFRLNFRDHGETHGLNEELFHSCRLDEVGRAVARVARLHPAPRVYLVGYSLGGNFALRIVANASRFGLDLRKVIAVCPVLHPHATMRALENGLWIYRRYFLSRWRRSLAAKAAAFPHLYDFGDLRRFRTLTATTAFFVERYTEFANLDAYLEGYSLTGPVLADLAVPARLIAARDDPVIPHDDLAAIARTDALEVTLLPRGGHCGFVESFRLTSWVDERLVAELA